MTPILKVMARDQDSGENGKILYRITNGSEFFGIDEKTGQIYTNRELDREEKERYNLTIVAEDRGNVGNLSFLKKRRFSHPYQVLSTFL